MTTEYKSLTAQWTAAQDQVAQAEARLANFKAHRETLEGELYRILSWQGGFQGVLPWVAAWRTYEASSARGV